MIQSGCKQDVVVSDCIAMVDSAYYAIPCNYSGELTNDSFYLNSLRPVQTIEDPILDVDIRCSAKTGEVLLDTAIKGEFTGTYFVFIYGDYFLPGAKLYSLYGPGTSGKLTITSIDTAERTLEGKFSGLLSRKDSTAHKVRIMIEKFKGRYR